MGLLLELNKTYSMEFSVLPTYFIGFRPIIFSFLFYFKIYLYYYTSSLVLLSGFYLSGDTSLSLFSELSFCDIVLLLGRTN